MQDQGYHNDTSLPVYKGACKYNMAENEGYILASLEKD